MTAKSVNRVILIDDEASVLFALKLLLEALEFTVKDFNLPEEALSDLASGSVYDLCICDLKMPKLNGIEVLTETKKICPSLPFVLMSAHANSEEVMKARSLGACGFLAKPFTPEQLKELVKSISEGTVS